MFENIPQSFIGFIITGIFIWQFIPVAQYVGLVDKPGGHKTHQGFIPVIGGMAMFLGILSSFLFFNIPWVQVESVLLAGILVLVIGSIDDKYFLSFYIRFAAQIGAALILVIGSNTLLTDVGHLITESTLFLGSWTIPLTIFAIVGVINAVNLSDGLDGLAGGLSVVTLCSIVILLTLSGASNSDLFIPLTLISVVSAFLMFNLRTPWLHKAKIFMGNGGSMLLGILLAWLLIKFSQGQSQAFPPVAALWIFAVPLLDTVTIMSRRMLKGKSPFSPDREHLHHLFLSLGFSVAQSVTWVLGIASSFALIGILSVYYQIPENILFFGFLVIFSLYYWSINQSWEFIERRKTRTVSVTGGTDNSVIAPLKRERYKD